MRDDEQHRQSGQGGRQRVHQLARGRVDPMRVLQHQQQGLALRLPGNQLFDQLDGRRPLLLGRHVWQRYLVLSDREQQRQQGQCRVPARRRCSSLQQSFELGQRAGCAFTLRERGRLDDLRDDGMKRRVHVKRRALVAQA